MMLKQKFTDVARQGYIERIFTKTQTSNATIRIVDNLVEKGPIQGCDDRNTLRWRMAPNRFGAPGRLDGQSEFVPFGRIMFFPANILYQTRKFGQAEQNRMVIFTFENELDNMMSSLLDSWSAKHLNRCFDIRCGRIDVSMNRLSHEIMNPGFASEILLEGVLTSVAVDVVRYFKGEGPVDESLQKARSRGLSPVHMKVITDFIMSAREGCPTAAQLAAVCGMNPSTFRQRFKQTTGKSLHAYVEEVRLNRAKAFLTDSELSMKEIAYELGFTHQATFSSSFRRVVGLSPSEYRLAHWN